MPSVAEVFDVSGFTYDEMKNIKRSRLKWWCSADGAEFDLVKHYQCVLWLLNEEYIHATRWSRYGNPTREQYINMLKKRITHLSNVFEIEI